MLAAVAVIGGFVGGIIGGHIKSYETIQMGSKSDSEIKEALEQLRSKARIKDNN